MKGIIGKKLGMTQLFDPETGRVTPVTVIEAGPCPIVKVKTVDSDGYEAVQLAFDRVAERKISKAERGHLGELDPHRRLVEFRGTTELTEGENVTVEAFEPGDSVKVSGIGIGKGFAGTIKRHNFSRGPVSHTPGRCNAPPRGVLSRARSRRLRTLPASLRGGRFAAGAHKPTGR